MARVILVTGGCRSGKSAHAQQMAESLPGRRAYLATAPVCDDEMRQRVAAHRQARAERQWTTLEEPLDLAGVLRGAAEFEVVLVDCLTLWVNNLLHAAEQAGRTLTETDAATRAAEVMDACRTRRGTVIFVTNEVGMGIVPEHASARLYRDLAGRCNQIVAAGAETVHFLVSGIPLTLKGNNRHGIA